MASVLAPEQDPGRLDHVFHALADPTRRAILARLATRSATVTDLAKPFAISLPAVSKHLKVLERAGLISRDVEGRRHRCSLEAGALREVDAWLGPYQEFWEAHFAALAGSLGSTRGRGRRRVRPPASKRTRRPGRRT
ncbi:MAG: metalloregulator ArsR/SmtB family transcription factor [Thermoplasmata archaeon]|nr:metalloregulator ArsR/SmtB family transcription factor [Thermoplasmata archaeon]